MISIIDHRAVPETPWRPNYRMWHIAGPDQGVSSTLSYSQVSPGAGAPLHYHEADELIVVLEGALEARLGDETQRVGPNHTIVLPPRVPHAFSSVGSSDAHVLAFFPVPDPFAHTTYLEGRPPAPHGSAS